MARVPPSPRPEEPARRQRSAWVISGLLHLLVLGWWASLPEPPPPAEPPAPPWAAIELVELPPAVLPSEPSPAETREPETSEPESSEPDELAPVEPSPAPTSPRPRTPRRSEPSPAAPSEPTEPPSSSGPSSGGVALLGLRGGSRPDPNRSSLRPSLSPSTLGRGQVVREVGGARVELPDGPSDGKPRSLVDAGFHRTRGGKMVYTDRQTGFRATLLPDGRLKFRITVTPASMPGMSEIVRAAQGQELYQQQKKRLLEETFELRLQMAVDFARDKMERRLKSLYRDLLEQWSDDSSSEASRREGLFHRWDECEEGFGFALSGFEDAHSSEIDELRRESGQQARETIEGFIRRHLPKGSPQAYSEDELRRLNGGRHSRARFAPYG
ncbi:MAG: hypothetical protein H6712_12435 [Myxococcales bacterium]|nr:hypothetical protein [Myxococcales bacterium]MCB9714664.1 hypothetical protein [Myxococcales bacterium]